jgi:hypothetical protein
MLGYYPSGPNNRCSDVYFLHIPHLLNFGGYFCVFDIVIVIYIIIIIIIIIIRDSFEFRQ